MSAQPQPLPLPLVKLTQHPLKWVSNKLELLIAALVLAHIGTLIVIGGYYLVFETWHPITHVWHNVPTGTRHLLRNVYEGVLGGTLAQLVVWNHFSRRRTEKLSRLDELEFKYHIPNVKDTRRLNAWQLVALPFLVIVYAIPGFIVGFIVVQLIKHGLHSSILASTGVIGRSTWSHVQTLWTSNYDEKLVGFFASLFLGRRVMRGVADDVQGLLAGRRVALQKPPRFYHPPNFRARMNGMSAETATGVTYRAGRLVPVLLTGAIVAGLALAGFGYYVIAYIAR